MNLQVKLNKVPRLRSPYFNDELLKKALNPETLNPNPQTLDLETYVLNLTTPALIMRFLSLGFKFGIGGPLNPKPQTSLSYTSLNFNDFVVQSQQCVGQAQ